MEAEASVGWGGTCLATPAALASQPPSPVDMSAPAFWGKLGGEKEADPPNRSQKPHPYSISESLPQTGLGDKEGPRRMETRWTGQTKHRLVGHKRQQKGSYPCHMDTQIHTSPWRQPEQRGYRQVCSPTPDAQRYTWTQKQVHACTHNPTLRCKDKHRRAPRNWQGDVYRYRRGQADGHKESQTKRKLLEALRRRHPQAHTQAHTALPASPKASHSPER